MQLEAVARKLLQEVRMESFVLHIGYERGVKAKTHHAFP